MAELAAFSFNSPGVRLRRQGSSGSGSGSTPTPAPPSPAGPDALAAQLASELAKALHTRRGQLEEVDEQLDSPRDNQTWI